MCALAEVPVGSPLVGPGFQEEGEVNRGILRVQDAFDGVEVQLMRMAMDRQLVPAHPVNWQFPWEIREMKEETL
jgi:hypothetical protein